MIDEVYLHESSEDKARKLSGAIKEKAKGSLFVANNSKKPDFTEEETDVFNYVFAGDLLLGINQNMKRLRYMRFWIRIWIPVFGTTCNERSCRHPERYQKNQRDRYREI